VKAPECSHKAIIVNIRVMGWEQYSWTEADGLCFEDAAAKSEIVPKSGVCMDCRKRVFGNFERKP
jgi:hypothetical protein